VADKIAQSEGVHMSIPKSSRALASSTKARGPVDFVEIVRDSSGTGRSSS
jgi:hypothetical protein